MVAELVELVPLAMDPNGVYRVGGTRVSLDSIVHAFKQGCSAEEIVDRFPSVSLPDVYQVIGYYLRHKTEITEYLEQRQAAEQAAGLQCEGSPDGLLTRLIERRSNA